MKIILSGDDIAPALEQYRRENDPDNSVPLEEIISTPLLNKHFREYLLEVIIRIMFPVSDSYEVDIILVPSEEKINDFITTSELFAESIEDVTVLGESCDIVLSFKTL